MPRNAEGMLDDVGGSAAAETAAPEPAVTEAAPVTEEPVKAEAAETPKPDKANAAERPEGYIPREALSRVQSELQAERQARTQAEANFQKFLDRWHAENQPAKEEQRAAPEHPGDEPDAVNDPYEYGIWRQKADRYIRHQQETQRSQQTAEQQRVTDLKEIAKQGIREFAVSAPDYGAARNYVWDQRGPELMELGLTQEQAIAQLEADELQIIEQAVQRGRNPAEVMYNIAKHRGYQAKAADAAKPAEVDGAGDRMRDATGKFVASEAEKAARIKESQERNGSLTQAPGTPVEKMSAKEFAKMDESKMWQEFDKMNRRKGSKDFDREMGFR